MVEHRFLGFNETRGFPGEPMDQLFKYFDKTKCQRLIFGIF